MFSSVNGGPPAIIAGVALALGVNIFTMMFVGVLSMRTKYKRIWVFLNNLSLGNFLLRLLAATSFNTLATIAFIYAVSVDNPYRIAFCVTIVIMTLAIEWAYVRRWAGLPILPRRRR